MNTQFCTNLCVLLVTMHVVVLQVVATFQRMRREQRGMASKAAELEMEINEHRLVIIVSSSELL